MWKDGAPMSGSSLNKEGATRTDRLKETSPFMIPSGENERIVENTVDDDSHRSVASLENGSPGGDKEILQSLFEEVEAARNHFRNYLNLISFMFFTMLYMAILYLQADAYLAYRVSLAHSPLLPPVSNITVSFHPWALVLTSYFDKDYAADQANIFSSLDDIYDWLNNSIIQRVWTDIECGNGICDIPKETPAYGPDLRYGCAADCGIFEKTTKLYVTITTGFVTPEDQAASSWNLCMRYPMEFCWYEQEQVFSGDLKATYELVLDIPDGNWTYQTNAPLGTVFAEGSFSPTADFAIFSFLPVCNTDKNEDFITPYTRCRQQCETGFLECYVKQCPSISSKDLSSSFLQCLSICSITTNATYQAELIASYNCSERLTYINGNDGCPVPPPPPPPAIATTTVLFNSSVVPRTTYRTILWEKLGASNEERYANLGFAVQRGLYSWIKDECFLTTPKSLGMARRLTAFFCTYFGGPVSFPGCNYTSVYSGKNLTTDGALFREMAGIHSLLDLAQDQQEKFEDTFVWALQSVHFLDGSTVAAFTNRIHQLYNSIVLTDKKMGCLSVFNIVPMITDSKESSLTRNVAVGEILQFVWEDDQEHSVITITESYFGYEPIVYVEGFGSNNLYISRNEICSPSNLGEGDLDSDPMPCNLVDPSSSPPHPFTYSVYFGSNETESWQFSSGRTGDTIYGVVNVNASRSDLSSQCLVQSLADSQCDTVCNTADYGFDGGDCACPLNEFGINVCSCPAGQVKNLIGFCCDPGANFTDFLVSNFSTGSDSAITNAEIIGSGDVALIRSTANINRVIVGMLVEQKRKVSKTCDASATKFTNLVDQCFGALSSSPFGIAPQTLLASSLYNGTFVNVTSQVLDQNGSFANSSLAFNPQGIPFAFYPVILDGVNYGFKYLFDVNLENSEADILLTYLKDGFFLDNVTSQVDVKLLTFNGEARLFTIIDVTVKVAEGGVLDVHADVNSLEVEHYKTKEDWIRFGLEIIYVLALSFDIVDEMHEFVTTARKHKHLFAYFHNFWNTIDMASAGIMVSGVVLWAISVLDTEKKFRVLTRYDVYENPITTFNYWKLSPETKMKDVLNVFNSIRQLSNFHSYYFSISGINVFLLVLRILKLMSFHPRMGAITRTFAVAAPDLVHFFIVFGFIFVAYAFYGHLVFGRLVDQFRTLPDALNSCFRMLMGQDSAADYLFRLTGWELMAGLIFWWSFVLILVLVVLNLLIGIISDAYSGLKEEVNKTGVQWIFDDIWAVLRNVRKQISPLSYSRMEISKVLQKFGAKRIKVERGYKNHQMKVEIDGKLVDENFLKDFLQRFPKHRDYDVNRLAVDILEELVTLKPKGGIEEEDQVQELKQEVEELKQNVDHCLKLQLKIAEKLGVDLD